jgi:phage tail protein X
MATTVKALQGDTLDQLCLRHLGATAGIVEQTLALNPGLADIGPVLPLGHAVQLPAQRDTRAATTTRLKLWD